VGGPESRTVDDEGLPRPPAVQGKLPRSLLWLLVRGESLRFTAIAVAEDFGDAGLGQPPAADGPSFFLDQPAPHSVSTDTGRVPQRELQAVRAYRAAGADDGGLGLSLLSGQKPGVAIVESFWATHDHELGTAFSLDNWPTATEAA
jgi:hypothetical protein